MSEETPLEKACKMIVDEKNYTEFYDLLGNLLLLNYKYVKENDSRLSAKVTAILFDKGLKDKAHLICVFLENSEMNVKFSKSDILLTKKLLILDSELEITQKIVDNIKQTIPSEELHDKLVMNVRSDLQKYLIDEFFHY